MRMQNQTTTRALIDESIKRALRFADQHLGDSPFSFEQMADEACVSRFHFHRVFKALLQETPGEYVRRIRLDTAARMVVERTDLSLTQVVFECGFTSQSLFSRQFKERFGVSPTSVRKAEQTIPQKIGPKACLGTDFEPQSVEIRSEPAKIAFCALARGYSSLPITLAYTELYTKMALSGLLKHVDKEHPIGISWDNPDITPMKLCRYYAGLIAPPNLKCPRGLFQVFIPKGPTAVLHYVGPETELKTAYAYLYSTWLSKSEYLPANFPSYSIYYKTPAKNKSPVYEADILLPLQKIK